MTVFPKLVNNDTLPVQNILFDSHWSAYLELTWPAMKGVVILREIASKCIFKMNDFKNVLTFYNIKYTPKL